MYNECRPGQTLLMSGKSSEALYNNVIHDFMMLNTSDILYTRNPSRIKIVSKKIDIMCVGADNESDWKRIAGSTIGAWYANEIVISPKSFVDMAVTRCSDEPRIKLWDYNPGPPNHHIKTDYMDNPNLDVYSEFFNFEDNPTLSQDYITELKAAFTGLFYQRYVLGKWVGFEGVIFDNWRPSHHVIDNLEIPAHWNRYLSIDFGFVLPNHAFVAQFWAEKPEGVKLDGWENCPFSSAYVLYREIYTGGRTNVEMAHEISLASKGDRHFTGMYADHDIEGIQTLRNNGLYNLTKCHKGQAINKIDAIYQALSQDKIFFMRGARTHPPMKEFVEAKCPTCTVEEFPQYRWAVDRSGVMTKEAPMKEYDHGIDATGYFLLSVQAGGAVAQSKDNW